MIVITAAFPFVPAELNIAHFASTYVPADIYKRLLQASGESVQLVSATDYHSIYASKDGRNTDTELCEQFHKEYLSLFNKMNIDFEQYITTNEEEHQKSVSRIFKELQKKQMVYSQDAIDYVCCRCGCHLPKRFMGEDTERKCEFCGSNEIEDVSKNHYFLKVAGKEEHIKEFAKNIKQNDVRNMILQYANNKFQDWNFTRYNQLGVPVPGSDEQSIYIWFDSLVGYYSLIKKCGSPVKQVVHFVGKNIVYYHGVIWPIIFHEGMEALTKINVSARGFLDFNKTDDKLVDLMKLTDEMHVDFVRFYLAFKVKDNISDYSFSWDDMKRTVDFYCCRKIGGFFYKAWKILTQNPEVEETYVEIQNLRELSKAFWEEIGSGLNEFHVHGILKKMLSEIDRLNAWMNKQDKTIFGNKEMRTYLMQEIAQLLCLLSAYMPSLAKKYSIFQGWIPNTWQEAKECKHYQLKKEKEIIKLNV